MNENAEFRAMELWENPQFPPEEQIPPFDPIPWADFRRVAEEFAAAARLALVPLKQLAEQLNVELPPPPREDGRPHPPRPSTTPPMWAQNPGRTRRTRNRSTSARTPFV